MNQTELKEAMNNHTPVYYIDDENYDYHCENTEYEVAEADVYKVYVPQQRLIGTRTYLQFKNFIVNEVKLKYLIDNKNIFSDPEEADKEATRRFKFYVKNLRKKAKKVEEALAECEKRLKEIQSIDV